MPVYRLSLLWYSRTITGLEQPLVGVRSIVRLVRPCPQFAQYESIPQCSRSLQGSFAPKGLPGSEEVNSPLIYIPDWKKVVGRRIQIDHKRYDPAVFCETSKYLHICILSAVTLYRRSTCGRWKVLEKILLYLVIPTLRANRPFPQYHTQGRNAATSQSPQRKSSEYVNFAKDVYSKY